MGTRNLTVVIHNEKPVIAQYGQWDGYPDGQGITALSFLQDMDRDKFVSQLEKCKFIDEEKQEEITAFLNSLGSADGWMTSEQARMYHKKYPLLTRDNGAGILQLVYDCPDDIIWVYDNMKFIADGLSNEWTYVIDLDKNVLEVYEGFTTQKPVEGDRFFELVKEIEEREAIEYKLAMDDYEASKDPNKRAPYKREKEYYMQLAGSFNLLELPTQESFLEYFERRQQEKED